MARSIILDCDNGSHFVGAQKGTCSNYTTWQRNPPAASHMRGTFYQISSARNILLSLLVTYDWSLSAESLRTLFTKTEGIFNSRPLTVEALGDVNRE